MYNFWNKYKKYYISTLVLGLPLLLGQLGVIITSFVDTIMVGQYSTQALASASFVSNLFNFMNILCLGFSYGSTPIIGSLFVKGDKNKVGAVVKNSMVLNLGFGAIPWVLMAALYFALPYMGQPSELMPTMRPYYITILLSMIPVIIVNVLRQFTDGISETKVSMWILSGGNLLNIIGNWLLIYGKCGFPEWGLFGAGVSTLAARVLMAVAYIAYIAYKSSYKDYIQGYMQCKSSVAEMRQIFRISIPVSLQMGMETGLFTAASIMVGWLGTDYLAAYQIIVILGTIGFLVYYSFGASMTIKISNYAGLDDVKQIKLSTHAGYHIILFSALIASVIFYFLGEYIILWFTADLKVLAIAQTLIVPLIIYQFGDATQVAFANALRGIKCVLPVMTYAAIAYVFIGIPLCYILAFPFHLSIIGIYLAFTVALFVAGMLYRQRFYRELKKM